MQQCSKDVVVPDVVVPDAVFPVAWTFRSGYRRGRSPAQRCGFPLNVCPPLEGVRGRRVQTGMIVSKIDRIQSLGYGIVVMIALYAAMQQRRCCSRRCCARCCFSCSLDLQVRLSAGPKPRPAILVSTECLSPFGGGSGEVDEHSNHDKTFSTHPRHSFALKMQVDNKHPEQITNDAAGDQPIDRAGRD